VIKLKCEGWKVVEEGVCLSTSKRMWLVPSTTSAWPHLLALLEAIDCT
jgi:hypothetical protein